MKKLLVCLLSMAFVLAMGGMAVATVSGPCVDCHTMHNSQDGTPMTFDGSATPANALTRGSCVGCHSNSTSATIRGTTNNIPVVYNTVAPTEPPATGSWSGTSYHLAGGNFYYVATGPIDAKGHNVVDIVGADAILGNTPPGYSGTYDPGTDYSTTYRLTCAGSNGCHGDRSVSQATYGTDHYAASYAGVRGAHHASGAIDGSSVGKSFRFLGYVNGVTSGTLGLEDTDWQQSASTSDHNEYKGATTTDKQTISFLCGHCHGNFHQGSMIGSGSPWLRHPTDIVLPNSGGYANYNGDGSTYSLEAPVGRLTIPATASGTVTPGTNNAIVLCLSCHRAHASNNADLLRWNYSQMLAGGGGATGTGCFVCHTDKD